MTNRVVNEPNLRNDFIMPEEGHYLVNFLTAKAVLGASYKEKALEGLFWAL